MLIIGSTNLLILGLNHFIFKEADKTVIYPVPKPMASEISEKEWQEQQKAQIEAEKTTESEPKTEKGFKCYSNDYCGIYCFNFKKEDIVIRFLKFSLDLKDELKLNKVEIR